MDFHSDTAMAVSPPCLASEVTGDVFVVKIQTNQQPCFNRFLCSQKEAGSSMKPDCVESESPHGELYDTLVMDVTS